MADVYVKVSDLKELVSRWRRYSDTVYRQGDEVEKSYGYDDCADELEELYGT